MSKLKKQRTVNRQNRLKRKIPTVAVIGYTNAGKYFPLLIYWIIYHLIHWSSYNFNIVCREPSGSGVECSTRHWGVSGLSLTSVTELCPWARHISPSLVLVQPRKTHSYISERLLMGLKESNQTKKIYHWIHWSSYNFNCVNREHSGSVVEYLTRDRGVAGSSLTVATALCPWAR